MDRSDNPITSLATFASARNWERRNIRAVLMGRYIKRGEAAFIAGPPKGLERACMELAAAMATGQPFQELAGPLRPLRVLWLGADYGQLNWLMQEAVRGLLSEAPAKLRDLLRGNLFLLSRDDGSLIGRLFPSLGEWGQADGKGMARFVLAVITELHRSVGGLDAVFVFTRCGLLRSVSEKPWSDFGPEVLPALAEMNIASFWIDEIGTSAGHYQLPPDRLPSLALGYHPFALSVAVQSADDMARLGAELERKAREEHFRHYDEEPEAGIASAAC